MNKTDNRRKRRRLTPDARRDELIVAALRVLKRHGNATARVEDVTAAAGAAKGTFYLYFSSWDDLLVAVRDHILDKYAARVRTRLTDPKRMNWWTLMDEECVRFIDFIVELGGLHDAIFHGPIAHHPIDDERSAVKLISEMLRAGIEARAFAPLDIEPSAHLVFSVLHETADAVARGGDRNRLIRSLRHLLYRWLSPDSGKSIHSGRSRRS